VWTSFWETLYVEKTAAEKLEIIAEDDKKKRSSTKIAQAYGIPLSVLSTYLKNPDSFETQALQGAVVINK
jgi:hypothetical protein